MSETKAKAKVKSEGGGNDSAKPKLLKSPQVGEPAVKVKKEAKLEPENPPEAKKKHSQTSVKAVKKEFDVSIKASKKEETTKTQKGDTPGKVKVKVVKKEEV
ncbi:hypothetical protein L7F22_025426 [Adiantum nelumboides]|nr:hypothetical protein [Adiantum nelumboides]